jgi:hypothetical protein
MHLCASLWCRSESENRLRRRCMYMCVCATMEPTMHASLGLINGRALDNGQASLIMNLYLRLPSRPRTPLYYCYYFFALANAEECVFQVCELHLHLARRMSLRHGCSASPRIIVLEEIFIVAVRPTSAMPAAVGPLHLSSHAVYIIPVRITHCIKSIRSQTCVLCMENESLSCWVMFWSVVLCLDCKVHQASASWKMARKKFLFR